MSTTCNGGMSTLIGLYASVASLLDEVAKQPIKGLCLHLTALSRVLRTLVRKPSP
jgi:hypothetical protein